MEEAERKPIFSNQYVTDEKKNRQLFPSLAGIRRVLFLVFGSLFTVYLIYQLIDRILWAKQTGEPVFSQVFVWFIVVGILLYITMILLLIVAPRRYAKRQTKQIREAYGTDQMELQTLFYDDELVLHNLTSKGSLRFQYTAFTMITETKDLFLLRTAQKQVVVLEKLGFTGADPEEFRAFMDEKCPGAKRKWTKEQSA